MATTAKNQVVSEILQKGVDNLKAGNAKDGYNALKEIGDLFSTRTSKKDRLALLDEVKAYFDAKGVKDSDLVKGFADLRRDIESLPEPEQEGESGKEVFSRYHEMYISLPREVRILVEKKADERNVAPEIVIKDTLMNAVNFDEALKVSTSTPAKIKRLDAQDVRDSAWPNTGVECGRESVSWSYATITITLSFAFNPLFPVPAEARKLFPALANLPAGDPIYYSPKDDAYFTRVKFITDAYLSVKAHDGGEIPRIDSGRSFCYYGDRFSKYLGMYEALNDLLDRLPDLPDRQKFEVRNKFHEAFGTHSEPKVSNFTSTKPSVESVKLV